MPTKYLIFSQYGVLIEDKKHRKFPLFDGQDFLSFMGEFGMKQCCPQRIGGFGNYDYVRVGFVQMYDQTSVKRKYDFLGKKFRWVSGYKMGDFDEKADKDVSGLLCMQVNLGMFLSIVFRDLETMLKHGLTYHALQFCVLHVEWLGRIVGEKKTNEIFDTDIPPPLALRLNTDKAFENGLKLLESSSGRKYVQYKEILKADGRNQVAHIGGPIGDVWYTEKKDVGFNKLPAEIHLTKYTGEFVQSGNPSHPYHLENKLMLVAEDFVADFQKAVRSVVGKDWIGFCGF